MFKLKELVIDYGSCCTVYSKKCANLRPPATPYSKSRTTQRSFCPLFGSPVNSRELIFDIPIIISLIAVRNVNLVLVALCSPRSLMGPRKQSAVTIKLTFRTAVREMMGISKTRAQPFLGEPMKRQDEY
jgi:hypothetical protein